MIAQTGNDGAYLILLLGAAIIVIAFAFCVSLARWIFRIDYRVDQQRQIIEALERIEDRLGSPPTAK